MRVYIPKTFVETGKIPLAKLKKENDNADVVPFASDQTFADVQKNDVCILFVDLSMNRRIGGMDGRYTKMLDQFKAKSARVYLVTVGGPDEEVDIPSLATSQRNLEQVIKCWKWELLVKNKNPFAPILRDIEEINPYRPYQHQMDTFRHKHYSSR